MCRRKYGIDTINDWRWLLHMLLDPNRTNHTLQTMQPLLAVRGQIGVMQSTGDSPKLNQSHLP